MTGRGEPIRIIGMQTTAAFFDVFDAPPLLGRTYHEATDQPGAAVAVISETIWKQQFGSDPRRDRHAGPSEWHADRDHRRRAGIPAPPAKERRVDAVAVRRADIAVRHRRRQGRHAACTTSASSGASRPRRSRCVKGSSSAIGDQIARRIKESNVGDRPERRTARGEHGRRRPYRDARAARRGRVRAADRVRQRGRSADRAGRGTTARAGRPHRARRRPRPADAATADRERRARAGRRRARAGRRDVDAAAADWPGAENLPRLADVTLDWRIAMFALAATHCRRRAFRAHAGAAVVASGAERAISRTAAAPGPRAPACATSWSSPRWRSRSCC